MPKILVLDHTLNSESMASCSLINKNMHFFGLNTSISIDDNLQACKPDLLLINKHFVTETLLNQMIQQFKYKVYIYNIDYIIPNFFVHSNRKVKNKTCIICLHDHHMVHSRNILITNNGNPCYPAIYSYTNSIQNDQMAGLFEHTKDLFEICDSYGSIVDASGGYMRAFCKYYGWRYGQFKPNEEILFVDLKKNTNEIYLTNKDIYEQQLL
jgi:hypothetical protein